MKKNKKKIKIFSITFSTSKQCQKLAFMAKKKKKKKEEKKEIKLSGN